MAFISAEELLSGGQIEHNILLPQEFVTKEELNGEPEIVLRPLTVRDLQKIHKASASDEDLAAALMIQNALIKPQLRTEDVSRLPVGLAQFILAKINTISGIDTPRTALQEMVQTPLARACFILSKEFGWTPEEVSGMTIGQILLYLEMIQDGNGNT